MTPGAWYTQVFSDEIWYFRPSGVVLMNGNRAGELGVVYTDRPRARPRFKRASVPHTDFSLWTPVATVPDNVVFYADRIL